MKKQNTFVRLACAAVLASAVLMSPMVANAKTALSSEARITLSEARAIALKAHPGKIMQEELEREGGGSGLRYSFDLKQGKQWREVGVDAITGKVLENVSEGANPKD
ncbi:MAG: PepSY domain-containing protein [Pseudolabrys sp.]|jgi:uncharacterized membrane protein YkoI